MYIHHNSRPGIRVPIDINFISATNASGIVAASATKRYYIKGWDLSVPSGTIQFNFKDGTSDVSGKFTVTKDAPSAGNCLYHVGLNKSIQIKVSAPVTNLVGDVWYEEDEVVTKDPVGGGSYLIGPYPSGS